MPNANNSSNDLNLLADLVAKAKRAGADAADAVKVDVSALSAGVRLGQIETLDRAESGDLGLRVFVGKKQAIASTTDCRPAMLDELVSRAVAMAKAAPEDEFCGLAPAYMIAKNWPSPELADTVELSAEKLIAETRMAEEAARAVKGVTNSEGADAGNSAATIAMVASNGFAGSYQRTHYSISAVMLAGEGTSMERDYDSASRVFAGDLPKAEEIGRNAGERAVRRLGARKMPTAQVPVVFDPRVANSLLWHLSGAISGAAIARGTSFLKDKLGQQIFPANINIVDDPHRARGLRSHPFDGEGLLPEKRKIIDKGVLTTWLLDMRSARQLKLKSTGHASRSSGSLPSPSPSNFYFEGGTQTPADLIRGIKNGFYITDLMGSGANGITGDYSRAAGGFWIENGTISFPVNEMTIAGNLKDMFFHLTPANDLQFLYGFDAPTIRIEGMTAAGV